MKFKEFKELITDLDLENDVSVRIFATGASGWDNVEIETDVDKLVLIDNQLCFMDSDHWQSEVKPWTYYNSKFLLNPDNQEDKKDNFRKSMR